MKAGYPTPIRTTRGDDILAACGQLKSKTEKRKISFIFNSLIFTINLTIFLVNDVLAFMNFNNYINKNKSKG